VSDAASNEVDPTRRWLLTASVLLSVLLYAVDTTVANVALPVIQGNLAITREQSSWVLTSYLIASAVALPALSAIESRLGLLRSYLTCVMGFGIASVLCAIAPNIEALVVARFLQGLCGAGLIPLGQTALQTVYPRHLLTRAFAVLGVGVMIGPVLGPWVGGLLTDEFGWRAVFYINVPFVILATIGLAATLPRQSQSNLRPFDALGFILLGVCIVCLQLALDRGDHLDWFDSTEIIIEVGVAVITAYMFVVHMRTSQNTLISPTLLRDRNMRIGLVMSVLVGWPFMGAMVLLPQFLQEVQGYSVTGAGILLAPRGLGLMLSMMALGRFGVGLDARAVFSAGCVINAVGLAAVSGAPSDAPADWLTAWLFFQGIGLGLMFVPLNTISFATLSAAQRTEGAALLTLARNLGSGIGVAILIRGISHDATAAAQHMAEASRTPMPMQEPTTLAWLLGEWQRESLVVAYANQHLVLAILPALLVPIVWLAQKPPVNAKNETAAVDAH
jgi:DHA2 family multidrug resistance protein